MIVPNALILPNPESSFKDGHAIVADGPLPTYAGHVHKDHEAFPGKWVYPFPTEKGAHRALDRILTTTNDRASGVAQ